MNRSNVYLVTLSREGDHEEMTWEVNAYTSEDAAAQARIKFQGWTPAWFVTLVAPLDAGVYAPRHYGPVTKAERLSELAGKKEQA